MSVLTNWVLKRRAATVLIMVVVLIFGAISVTQLKNELLPNIDFPLVTVSTFYPGASAGDVEELVSKPVEQVVGAAPRIKSLRTISRENFSFIIAEFEYGTDIKGTQQTIESNLRNVNLPTDLRGQRVVPTVSQLNINSQPVLYLGLEGAKGQNAEQLSDVARNTIKPALASITGVSNVEIVGDQIKQVQIVPNPQALQQRGLTISDISNSLKGFNTSFPGGTAEVAGQNVPVRTAFTFGSIDDMKNLPVAGSATAAAGGTAPTRGTSGTAAPVSGTTATGATPAASPAATGSATDATATTPAATTGVTTTPAASTTAAPAQQANPPAAAPAITHLSDVATVTEVVSPSSGISRTNGQPGVLLEVFKTQSGNTVDVSDQVTKKVDDLAKQSNGAYNIRTVYDTAGQIRSSIEGLGREGILGALFAILVIFIFLRNVRSTLVTAISIPTSIVVAFILLWTQGISLNIMTLGGLAIAVGRVVDDAIVVLENIFRRVQEGEPVEVAVKTGPREVAGAITSSTLTTIAVFLPLGFVGGITGQFFLPFALTVTFALLASLVVALTIIPVFASFFINRKAAGNHSETKDTWIQRLYTPPLKWALRNRWKVLAMAAVLFFASNFLVTQVPLAFLPDSGDKLLQVSISTAAGTSQDVVLDLTKKVEDELAKDSRVALRQTTIAGNSSFAQAQRAFGASSDAGILVRLDKSANVQDTAKDLRAKLKPLVPANGNIAVAPIGGFSSSSFSLNVQANNSEDVRKASDIVLSKLKQISDEGKFANLKSDVSSLSNQVLVTPKTDVAGGRLNTQTLGFLVAGALQPTTATTVRFGSNGLPEDVVINPPYELGKGVDLNGFVNNLKALPIAGGLPLGAVADIKVVQAQTQTTRIGQKPAASVSADVTVDDTGGVTREVNSLLKNVESSPGWPAGASYAISGVSQQQGEAFGGLFIAMGVAIALVYIVMVLAFGSLLEPFAILFSLPLATIGAFAALFITHRAIGLPAMIGLLMLIGIVVTNAIVLLDRVNQNRERGMARDEALIEAGRNRIRPILMTAMATILALIPLALGFSEGSIIAAELGTVVIGGLLTSTFLTLIVVPVVYSLLIGGKERLTGRGKRKNLQHPHAIPTAPVILPAADSGRDEVDADSNRDETTTGQTGDKRS
ncbi:MAG TPA: efflux RND transporter permease subunit [Chloroflexia bacterium]|nr:efflux RND transporter permease subunit [Chloroflexia bacterium]